LYVADSLSVNHRFGAGQRKRAGLDVSPKTNVLTMELRYQS